jgi:hypothetical protein
MEEPAQVAAGVRRQLAADQVSAWMPLVPS